MNTKSTSHPTRASGARSRRPLTCVHLQFHLVSAKKDDGPTTMGKEDLRDLDPVRPCSDLPPDSLHALDLAVDELCPRNAFDAVLVQPQLALRTCARAAVESSAAGLADDRPTASRC